DDPSSFEFLEDGLLVTRAGHIDAIGRAHELMPNLSPDVEIVSHNDSLLIPGFIDAHIHYPQTDVVGSGGRQLLDWLEDYTFPTERRFSDPVYARQVAEFFLDELVRNGTTTAMVFCTVHPESVDAFFTASEKRELRMIAGKVMMDRHCPDFLCDTAERGAEETEALIQR